MQMGGNVYSRPIYALPVFNSLTVPLKIHYIFIRKSKSFGEQGEKGPQILVINSWIFNALQDSILILLLQVS